MRPTSQYKIRRNLSSRIKTLQIKKAEKNGYHEKIELYFFKKLKILRDPEEHKKYVPLKRLKIRSLSP